jgi:hypothetical protein
MLSMAGAVLGFVLGQAGAALIRQLYPPSRPSRPDWAVLAGSARRSSPASSSASCRRARRRGSIRCSRWPGAEAGEREPAMIRHEIRSSSPGARSRAPAAQLPDRCSASPSASPR